jgi:hypothetical protein
LLIEKVLIKKKYSHTYQKKKRQILPLFNKEEINCIQYKFQYTNQIQYTVPKGSMHLKEKQQAEA